MSKKKDYFNSPDFSIARLALLDESGDHIITSQLGINSIIDRGDSGGGPGDHIWIDNQLALAQRLSLGLVGVKSEVTLPGSESDLNDALLKSFRVPDISDSDFFENFDLFLKMDKNGYDYYIFDSSLGNGRGRAFGCNLGTDIVSSIISCYDQGGLGYLTEQLIKNDIFFRSVSSNVLASSSHDGWTTAGRIVYDKFRVYDSSRQDKYDKMIDRLNDWSSGKIDAALDKTSDLLKRMISDE